MNLCYTALTRLHDGFGWRWTVYECWFREADLPGTHSVHCRFYNHEPTNVSWTTVVKVADEEGPGHRHLVSVKGKDNHMQCAFHVKMHVKICNISCTYIGTGTCILQIYISSQSLL